MGWQSMPLPASRIPGSRSGKSPNATAGASNASSVGSVSSAIAAARRRPWVQRGRCDGAMRPTWLDTSRSRRLWNGPPSMAVTGRVTIPAHFQHSRLVSGQFERRAQPIGRAAGVNDEIAIGLCASGLCETNPELRCQFRAAGVDVDQRNVRTGDPPAQIGHKGADHAGPDHGDAVGRSRRGVPDAVERGLHIGGQHRAERRHILRKHHGGARRDVERGLMRVKREDGLASQGIAAVLDPSDRGVAVFDGKRKIACHERRAHPLELAHRYAPAKARAIQCRG